MTILTMSNRAVKKAGKEASWLKAETTFRPLTKREQKCFLRPLAKKVRRAAGA